MQSKLFSITHISVKKTVETGIRRIKLIISLMSSSEGRIIRIGIEVNKSYDGSTIIETPKVFESDTLNQTTRRYE